MKFAEFFAGVGLVHEGLARDKWDCVWANDIAADKQETYQANFGGNEFFLGDIWDCVRDARKIPNGTFLYTASFPCTDLSVAGERRGLAGDESGTLNAVLEILRRKKKSGDQPYVVMLENVQGFLTSHNGADVVFTVKAFNDLGYVVDLIELDAAHFTPQSRPRVFLFAVRAEVASLVMSLKSGDSIMDTWWSDYDQNPELRTNKIRQIVQANPELQWGAFDFPRPSSRQSTLADIIEADLSDASDLWWNDERKKHLHSQMSELHKSTLQRMVASDRFTYGTVYRRMRQDTIRAELRTDGIAGCLRTPRGGSSKQILIRAGFGSWSVRLLTPREYARLQGVRDDFRLPDNANKAYFAMGDAVCVPAIEFLSRHALTPTFKAVAPLLKK